METGMGWSDGWMSGRAVFGAADTHAVILILYGQMIDASQILEELVTGLVIIYVLGAPIWPA